MKSAHKILLLGSGGRENALAWKISQSDRCEQLFIAPGNAGSSAFGTVIDISVNDFERIAAFCKKEHISILVPGPEEPLVNGIYDFFQNDKELKDIIICGPSKSGAQLEGSKAFSKKLMSKYGIPTASYREFDSTNFQEGISYLQQHTLPIVVKADGLAAGKGVVIASTHEEAIEAFTDMIQNQQFGSAGSKVVIEEFLSGIELSVFALCNGENYVILPTAKDYKRIGEGDKGLNTGGMGAISPVPFATSHFMEKVRSQIVEPTLKGLVEEGHHYQGFLFFGLINVDDEPYVIEYNCRMGDPETEVVMPRLESDLVKLIEKMQEQKLDQKEMEFVKQDAATVIVVSGGYPGDYKKDKVINGLEQVTGCIIFHAGTKEKNGETVTAGGRVLAITGLGTSLQQALEQSYAAIGHISFDDMYYRKDIGYEFVEK